MRRTTFVAIAIMGALCAASPAHADILSVGGSGSPDALSVAGDTFLTSVTNSGTDSETGLNVTITTSVYETAQNTLTFTYLLQNNSSSTDIVTSLTASNYSVAASVGTGKIDMGADNTTSGVAPNNVAWEDAATLKWTFGSNINPGHSSELLIVETQATNYAAGLVTAQNSGVVQVAGLEPAVGTLAVPEPSTMAIAGLGALGMIGYLLRRRKSA